ncbi:MAG: hypothetical protein Q4A05_11025, partial [Ruminococcus sp.]|nr:hypothetical protein [Ruminococcus sp.]
LHKFGGIGSGAGAERTIFRNPECEIANVGNTIIVGRKGSTAETYAKENDLTFELLDDYDKAQETATTTTTTTT